MKLNKKFGMAGVGLIFMIGCGGGSQPLISRSDIDAAQKAGTLESLYQKADGLAKQASGGDKKEIAAIQSSIAQLLVKQRIESLDQLLDKRQQNVESVSRADLLKEKAEAEKMKTWSETEYTLQVAKLNQAISETNELIVQHLNEADRMASDPVQFIQVRQKAALLAGDGQPEFNEYQKLYTQTVSSFLAQGNDALNKQLYSIAVNAAKGGLALEPGSVQFESMLSQGQAGLFEKDFRFALENGKPESAYLAFLNVVDEPIFLSLKQSMASSINFLINYFANAATQSYEKGDLVSAYQQFVKARLIQNKMGLSTQGFVQEKKFLELVMARAKNSASAAGKRLALLRVIKSFDAGYPALESEYNPLAEEVKNRALTKLQVDSFHEVQTNDSVLASIGRRVSSKLEAILFAKLGGEILVVTDLGLNNASEFQGLSLKIIGEVLQAAVETQTSKGQRAQNVQTGVSRIETEEYAKWAKRKRGEAPTQYIESPLMEDVTLTIEHIRKQAVAEIAFSIVEPASGKVLLTDSIVKEAKFSGETVNELLKGDFHQPYLPADLPSDIKIMDGLATEVADELGMKLTEYLTNPAQVFYQKYIESKSQNNVPLSIELLANAIQLAENKGVVQTEWIEELKLLSLQ